MSRQLQSHRIEVWELGQDREAMVFYTFGNIYTKEKILKIITRHGATATQWDGHKHLISHVPRHAIAGVTISETKEKILPTAWIWKPKL